MEQNLRDIWMNSFPISNELANGSLRLTEYKGQYYLWNIPSSGEPLLLETFTDNNAEVIEQQYNIEFPKDIFRVVSDKRRTEVYDAE